MSSILEALRELEGSAGPATTEAAPWEEEPVRWRAAGLALAAVLVVAGVGSLVVLTWRAASVADPTRVAALSGEGAPGAGVLPPAPPRPAPRETDQPRARVTPAAVTATAGNPAPAKVYPAKARSSQLRGEPRVDVLAIAYASGSEQRAVTLSVNGGSNVTLREGESAGGIQVQLIMPDSVYVRHGGQIFAVDKE